MYFNSRRFYFAIIVLFSIISGGFFGYIIGLLNKSLPHIIFLYDLSLGTIKIISKATFLGSGLGFLISGFFLNKTGRKKMIKIASIIFFFTTFFVFKSQEIYLIIFSRFLLGIGLGIFSITIILYLLELSPVCNRIMLLLIFNISLLMGIFFLYFLFVVIVDKFFFSYKVLFYMLNINIFFLYLICLYIPDSPIWKVYYNNYTDDDVEGDDIINFIKILNPSYTEKGFLAKENIKRYSFFSRKILKILILSILHQSVGFSLLYHYFLHVFSFVGFGNFLLSKNIFLLILFTHLFFLFFLFFLFLWVRKKP